MFNRHCQACGEFISVHSDVDLDKCVKVIQLVNLSESVIE